MPKGRKIHSLRVEVLVKIRKPPNVTVTDKFLREALEYWIETGQSPRGIEFHQCIWTRDGGVSQRAPSDRHDLENVRETLLRRLLHSIQFQITRDEA
jgi:hypothetical protein